MSLTTLLFGIDAGSIAVLSSLATDDAPNLQSVVDDGVSGQLKSQVPPWTPSAWPSLYTGTNPGKHGVFDFLTFDGYDWDVVNATHVRERPLWELLSVLGHTSVVVNVPVTAPPSPFDGALVPGYTAPEAPTCHPDGVFDRMSEAVGGYRVYPRPASEYSDPYDRYREVIKMRGDAFLFLADEYDPEFGFVQFQQTDTVFHDRPGDHEAVRAVYRAVDAEIGRIIDAQDPDNVFLVSDHGMGRYENYEFRVNDFLRARGYLTTCRGGRGMPDWSTIYQRRLRVGDEPTGYHPSLLDRAASTAARLGFTKQRVEDALDKVGLAKPIGRRLPASTIQAGTEHVDFAASTAYMRSRSELGVRINLSGREPDGVVPPEEYESVRSELIETLATVETPSGDPVFSDVAPREAYFWGPAVEDAVDIVTVPAGFDHLLSATLEGEQFGPPTQRWDHKLEGLIAATGTAIDSNGSVEGAHLFDVAPTVLASLGVPVDERMDGTVLPLVEASGQAAYPAYEGPDRRATDDRNVERQLEAMGYLNR